MKKAVVLTLALLTPQLALAWPWSTDMMNQPSIKPQELREGETEMRPFPLRSVPVGGFPTQVANRDEAKGLKNPIAADEQSMKEGRTLYRIYCATCHGLTGKAESPIAGKIGAIDLTDGYVQNDLTEGWIYGTITFGGYVMPAYGAPATHPEGRGSNDLSVDERWHVVNYVKHGLIGESSVRTAEAE